MQITLSQNLSYCVGVRRTLTLVEELLTKNPDKSYYVLGEIVHNEHVINDLRSRGLQFIRDIEKIENHGTVIIQSHGVSRAILKKLKDDELGLYGSEKDLGKSVGSDLKECKKTLHYYYLRQKAGQNDLKRFKMIWGNTQHAVS